jgi:hypothetical protein
MYFVVTIEYDEDASRATFFPDHHGLPPGQFEEPENAEEVHDA